MIQWIRFRYGIAPPVLKKSKELTIQQVTQLFAVSKHVAYFCIPDAIVQASIQQRSAKAYAQPVQPVNHNSRALPERPILKEALSIIVPDWATSAQARPRLFDVLRHGPSSKKRAH